MGQIIVSNNFSDPSQTIDSEIETFGISASKIAKKRQSSGIAVNTDVLRDNINSFYKEMLNVFSSLDSMESGDLSLDQISFGVVVENENSIKLASVGGGVKSSASIQFVLKRTNE